MEEWRPVVSYGGFYSDYYEVSSYGNVRSVDRKVLVKPKARSPFIKSMRGVTMTPTINKDGYLQTALTKQGRTKTVVVHRLVAQSFHTKPRNKPFVNHLDGNKQNNHKDNLAWCTHKENMAHAATYGLRPRGSGNHMTSLSENEVKDICTALDSGNENRFEIANKYGVSKRVIDSIHLGESWNWLTDRKNKVLPSNMIGVNNPEARSVINCRGEIFTTIKEAGERYQISWTGISRVVRGKGATAGRYEDNTRIKWKYYSEKS